MRSRDPVILKEVKICISESLFVIILFLCILKVSVGAQSQFAKIVYKFIEVEGKWQIHCVDVDPRDWGQYCHWLKLKIEPYPILFMVKYFLAAVLSATLLSCVCAELLLELQTRSLHFQEWYWDNYNFESSRTMAHGG